MGVNDPELLNGSGPAPGGRRRVIGEYLSGHRWADYSATFPRRRPIRKGQAMVVKISSATTPELTDQAFKVRHKVFAEEEGLL